MSTYKNKEIQTLFNVSSDTVRVWSEEFSAYLSPLATPGTGKHRVFNDDDLKVFALVSEMRGQNLSYEEIHASLQNGERGDLPQIAGERALEYSSDLQLSIAQDRISKLQNLLESAEQRSQRLHDENIRLETSENYMKKRVEEISSELQDEREKYQKQISDLQREIGKLEARLEIEQEKNEESEDDPTK